jgi:hypothetical protein
MVFVKMPLVALGKIENTYGGLILLATSPEARQLFHIKSNFSCNMSCPMILQSVFFNSQHIHKRYQSVQIHKLTIYGSILQQKSCYLS